MMIFCKVTGGIVCNMVVGLDDLAEMEALGYYPAGPDARIGEPYVYPDPLPEPEPEFEPDEPPPSVPAVTERLATLEAENRRLKAQASLQAEQTTMLEECLLEIAEIIYA